MILIADSGSTKTCWGLIRKNDNDFETCKTAGINPFLQDEPEITETLKKEFSLLKGHFNAIYFYGAGCANQVKNRRVRRSLERFFSAKEIFIDSDLMGAARSLCGDRPGIAAILGTGSNSCYYDGKKIIRHISPLGYILGDEGSGAIIGRNLLSDIFKKQLPEEICKRFFEKYRLEPELILEHIYNKPFPNRFMAKFTYFINDNIENPDIYRLLKNSFKEFFTRNISQYPEAIHLPVNATGSIAWHFKKVFTDAAGETGYSTGKITQSPMNDLIKFHLTEMET